ncbi:MAG: hypothetical protein F6K23_02250 [Okeania sp. SIO2C9]|uniref:hypothetical protein n=1 Tax=Okeania sp. SIO2C9 TaxID=2607791 RepID=UPI0013C007A7|nr:hypothetical protein [Okeania sp. SIO2C9]NEQ71995.1 hypothetical protein [Okeania sp. SIO2C9]
MQQSYQILERKNRDIEEKNRSLNNYNPHRNQSNNISKENQYLKNLVNDLKEEKKSQVIQLQTRIDDLESDNQKLHKRVSSLLSKLDNRDRDKSSTITSNDSRRQRDVLTQEFIQLNTQEITGLGNEIFNHLSQINSDLKAHRKREIAKIKSVFSKHIFGEGSQCFTPDNSIEEDKIPQLIEDFTKSILTDLKIPETAKIPEPIPTNLKNLVEKGLKLVKEIVNDDPPGHFLIANQGDAFNSEKHQPVAGCEPNGKIVYTTYPGYCVNDRIIGESLKTFVFTEPEEETSPEPQKPFETNQTNQQANSTDNEEQHSTDDQHQKQSNSTDNHIHLKLFRGQVVQGATSLYYRNSWKWQDKNKMSVINNEVIQFDAWTEGEIVEYRGQKNNIWYREVHTQLWLPKVYIQLCQ